MDFKNSLGIIRWLLKSSHTSNPCARGTALWVCCLQFAALCGVTVQAFSNAGPLQKSSVFCELGCIKAAVLLLLLITELAPTKKAEVSDFFSLCLVEALGAYGLAFCS